MSINAFVVLVILSIVQFVTCSPVSTIARPNELLVWSPKITSPTENAVWTTGSNRTVTWDTSDIPAEKINATGLLLLGHYTNQSENLDTEHPLASNFLLRDGQVDIVMPEAEPRKDYIVCLFGDSGNISGLFTISA